MRNGITGKVLSRIVVVAVMLSMAACGGSGDGSSSGNGSDTANSQPIATIATSASNTSYIVGTDINFSGSASDAEDGSIPASSLRWSSSIDGDLGTGAGITVQLSEGAHTVVLTAEDSGGLTHSDYRTVLVDSGSSAATNTRPQVAITSPVSGTSITSGQIVSLSGNASDAEDSSIPDNNLSWSSSIDGDIGTGAQTSATLSVGTHLISLVATDSEGLENVSTVAVTVTPVGGADNTAPVANPGQAQSVSEGQTVSLDGSSSTDLDGDDITYHWSFASIPTGSTAVLSDASVVDPSFMVDVAGDYIVQLVVSDGQVNSAPATVQLSTFNFAPVAYAGPDSTVLLGLSALLNGSASSDIEGSTLSYQWSIESQPIGSTATLTNPTTATPSIIPDVAGSYEISLLVNDGLVDSVPDTVTIQAGNVRPVANAFVIRPLSLTTGSTVTLDGSGSVDANGDALSYVWTLTSRPNGSSASLSSTTEQSPTLTVDQFGSYTAQLVVNDGVQNSQPVSVSFMVVNSTTEVHNIDFENNDLSGFTGSWEVVSSAAHSGTYALQPPSLLAGNTASAELVVNQVHTRISFWSYGSVDFYIDGEYYSSYSGYWSNEIITVPEGTHTYRWDVSVSSDSQPNLWIDDIVFEHTPVVANPDGPYGFEEGFLPPEFSGGWDIDNTGSHSGGYALRAPYMSAAGTASTELVYNQIHTQISFWHYGAVDFYIDDAYYGSFSGVWRNQIITVPEGIHTYRWSTTLSSNGRPNLYLDDISFIHNVPASAGDGPYGFEGGFLPLEFSGGWDVAYGSGHSGNYALMAPYMDAAGTASTELVYNQPHTQISFWHYGAVDFYIDDVYYGSFSGVWRNQIITVPEGTHTYRWSTTLSSNGRPNLFLDDISFIHNTPVSEGDGPYGFEGGFLSLDFSGGWDIAYGSGHSGNYALTPPYMDAAGAASTELVYNQPHTQISFWHYGAVDFYIDDVYYGSFSGVWRNQIITVPEGTHTYRWSTTLSSNGHPNLYLDDISFNHTAPTANPTGPYGFEEGFLPIEFTGGWDVVYGSGHSGNYALMPPYMAMAGTSTTTLEVTQPHTQISFWHYGVVDFYIDGVLQGSYSGVWQNQVFSVSNEAHTYSWSVTRTTDGRSSLYLDDIVIQ